MNIKTIIWKILFILFWVCICTGMLSLLIAAISRKNREVCSGYKISIKNGKEKIFIDQKDITRLLQAAIGKDLKGRKVTAIDLGRLEKLLQDNIWIRDAEMWFDNRNLLHIEVWEREPIARIFTTAGNTFYIDSNAKRIPLSDKMIISLPVFTGLPEKRNYTGKDSMLLQDVKQTALFISKNPFWKSQVEQINITDNRMFEMIPLVGNHIVKIGNGKELEKKFNRLMIFYKQVMAKTGFDVYSVVDVQYTGQVIATRKGDENNRVDTVALKRNIEQLLRQVQKQYQNMTAPNGTIEKPAIGSGSTEVSTNALRATNHQAPNPNTVKTQSLPGKKENKPKAVMPKKNQ